jgi:hypothetical protein
LLLPVKIRRILMKKILVLLLVLAVAGGVFAQQGTWSLSGFARVGAIVDFDPATATVGANTDGDNNWTNRGRLDVDYKLGNLSTKIRFQVTGRVSPEQSTGVSLTANYDVGNFRAQVVTDLSKLLGFGAPFSGSFMATNYKDLISELWGYYKLLGGLVHLEAAYAGRGDAWWESNTTYGDGFASLNDRGNSDGGLLANVHIESLDFGIMVPAIFRLGSRALVDDAVMKSVVGFKFVMAPVEFAAQFRFEKYGVYFGAKYTAGPVAIGLNFKGLMDGGDIGVGASADYTADLFGAGVGFKYQLRATKYMEVNPNFWYKVIPDYFYFKTELGFHFEEGDIIWSLTPQIAWNFLGNGAKGYTDLATGIGARFNLKSNNTKASNLWVGFKWGF